MWVYKVFKQLQWQVLISVNYCNSWVSYNLIKSRVVTLCITITILLFYCYYVYFHIIIVFCFVLYIIILYILFLYSFLNVIFCQKFKIILIVNGLRLDIMVSQGFFDGVIDQDFFMEKGCRPGFFLQAMEEVTYDKWAEKCWWSDECNITAANEPLLLVCKFYTWDPVLSPTQWEGSNSQ